MLNYHAHTLMYHAPPPPSPHTHTHTHTHTGKELDSEEDDVDEEGQEYLKLLAKKVTAECLSVRQLICPCRP